MDPHIVDKATMPPGQCLFSGDLEGPFIDLGLVAPWARPYGYLSVSYVEFLARELLAMVPAAEVDSLREQLAEQDRRIGELQEFIAATVEYEEARAKELA